MGRGGSNSLTATLPENRMFLGLQKNVRIQSLIIMTIYHNLTKTFTSAQIEGDITFASFLPICFQFRCFLQFLRNFYSFLVTKIIKIIKLSKIGWTLMCNFCHIETYRLIHNDLIFSTNQWIGFYNQLTGLWRL